MLRDNTGNDSYPLIDYFLFQEPSRDTFIVLSRRAKTAPDQVHRYSTTNSLFFMGPYHPIRLCAIRILVHKYPLRRSMSRKRIVTLTTAASETYIVLVNERNASKVEVFKENKRGV